jgi:hypothetical protein
MPTQTMVSTAESIHSPCKWLLASGHPFVFALFFLATPHLLTSLLIDSCRVPIRALSYKPSDASSVSLFTVTARMQYKHAGLRRAALFCKVINKRD